MAGFTIRLRSDVMFSRVLVFLVLQDLLLIGSVTGSQLLLE